ncbi:metal-dependent transcriptional regulator [Acutalibacter sp. 1XD8-33]|uniref:metal-dependent transcriptional regulator n=1 Tax=Acutalibacter sp. 1XD8-33 TaxID=2320081 RepID=UPI000EA0F433|nr:metal-dependent transcriptional regulator [Acutalibacter sp. 1XD8-33]RKJ41437.1 metal-dependent transcriptional regulator [Acutalibacter sp. 1XD8-33]
MGTEGFYTLKGYNLIEHGLLTSSMEDYLEMIYRMQKDSEGVVRVSTLAQALHVKPPSASKMAGNLRARELIQFPRYGYITLTETGRQVGEYLLRRHEIVHRLLCAVNGTQDELEQCEKIEHFLTPRTVMNIEKFLEKVLEG